MAADSSVDRYAVVGNPVSHSLSPRIHARFAEQTGQALRYEAIEIALGNFETGIRDLQRRGYAGLNVTVPFKQEAWAICGRRSRLADDAGAVNTLTLKPDGGIDGDNTDGTGLVRDLEENLGFAVGGARILLLGAGGAARGVIGPILERAPAKLTIANRSAQKAVDLAARFASRGPIGAAAYQALAGAGFDLIVNATAAGLAGDLPPLPETCIGAGTLCYDMIYDLAAPTAFVAWARTLGATRACDGLGMLVEQAAEAFHIWRGVRPDGKGVMQMLRDR